MENRKFTKHTRLFLCISAAIILVAIVLNLCGLGLNLGIDFTGGSLLDYSVGAEFMTEDVVNILSKGGYTEAQVAKAAAADSEDGALTDLQIRLWLTDYTDDLKAALSKIAADSGLTQADYTQLSGANFADKGLEETDVGKYLFLYDGTGDTTALENAIQANLDEAHVPCESVKAELVNGQTRVLVSLNDQASAVRQLLETEMTARYPDFKYKNIEHVGAVSGSDLVRNALLSLAVALVLMLVYIAIRFDPYSGLAAVFGLLHDILIMCAVMGFARALFQVNSSFIAAVLTIVGYSINNTIIIFDRVRENKKSMGKALSNIGIVENSISQSISRTINTTLTTLFALVALYVLGVESIREFTFPLIVGMLSGSYSAILLNGPVWAWLMDKAEARKTAKQAEAKKTQANA